MQTSLQKIATAKLTRTPGLTSIFTGASALAMYLLLMLCAEPLLAAGLENKSTKLKRFGDYTVHYNAFGTDMLQPNMAKAYGITRSKNRGMLSISVLKKTGKALGTAVKARITVKANNLTGQMKEIAVREINDAGSIYYVSEFRVAHKETLDFTVEAKLDDQAEPLVVKFRQQFYTN